MTIKKIVEDLFPLNRELVSQGFNDALMIIRDALPREAEYHEDIFAPGSQAWTWRVPERYIIHKAYLETESGQRVLDFVNHRLHVFSYSLPVNKWLTWEELEPHLHYSDDCPDAIPWKFTYYERKWGFCLTKHQFDHLPRNERYHAVIDVEYNSSPNAGLRTGVAYLPFSKSGSSNGEMLLCAHVDHPMQANDGISGVAVAIEVANRLANNPLPEGAMAVRFLFCPETIGSICYLSKNEQLIPQIKAGIFIEMAGNDNQIALQRSFQDNDLIDRIARYVLQKKGLRYFTDAFRRIVGNDEFVMNGPGVNIPTISLSRSPYPEYHTSKDTPDIIHEDMLVEMADVVEEIVRIYATNYVPMRKFRGPVFLSGNRLWIDWRTGKSLDTGQDESILEMEQIMYRLNGKYTVFDIMEELGLEYWPLWQYLNLFLKKGLIKAMPVPRIEVE